MATVYPARRLLSLFGSRLAVSWRRDLKISCSGGVSSSVLFSSLQRGHHISLPPGVGKGRCVSMADQESGSATPGSWGPAPGPSTQLGHGPGMGSETRPQRWWVSGGRDVTGEPGMPSLEGTRLQLRGRENSDSRDPWPARWAQPGCAFLSPEPGRAGPSPCLCAKPWLLISHDWPWCIVGPHQQRFGRWEAP